MRHSYRKDINLYHFLNCVFTCAISVVLCAMLWWVATWWSTCMMRHKSMGTCFFIRRECVTHMKFRGISAISGNIGQYDLFYTFWDVAQAGYISRTQKYPIFTLIRSGWPTLNIGCLIRSRKSCNIIAILCCMDFIMVSNFFLWIGPVVKWWN